MSGQGAVLGAPLSGAPTTAFPFWAALSSVCGTSKFEICVQQNLVGTSLEDEGFFFSCLFECNLNLVSTQHRRSSGVRAGPGVHSWWSVVSACRRQVLIQKAQG